MSRKVSQKCRLTYSEMRQSRDQRRLKEERRKRRKRERRIEEGGRRNWYL
jgi:hypothetical protein